MYYSLCEKPIKEIQAEVGAEFSSKAELGQETARETHGVDVSLQAGLRERVNSVTGPFTTLNSMARLSYSQLTKSCPRQLAQSCSNVILRSTVCLVPPPAEF